jgi:hypothetical protein
MYSTKYTIDLKNAKSIKVARCAKKICKYNLELRCRALDGDLAESGCFLRFTGAKKITVEEPLDVIFK